MRQSIFNKHTDLIQIIAPACALDNWHFILDKAEKIFSARNLKLKVNHNLISENSGLYANTLEFRTQDLIDAILDDNVKIIWALRGGYGTVDVCFELLNNNNWPNILEKLAKKIIIGYSDITALHCLLNNLGIASIHGNNIYEITQNSHNLEHILDLLAKETDAFDLIGLNELGHNNTHKIQGIITGGNLTVLSSLCGTKLEANFADKILILEDINEPIYKINRAITQLINLENNQLNRCRAIIFADFTPQSHNLYSQIQDHIVKLEIPIYKTTGFGHTKINNAIIFGAEYTIENNLLYKNSLPLLNFIDQDSQTEK